MVYIGVGGVREWVERLKRIDWLRRVAVESSRSKLPLHILRGKLLAGNAIIREAVGVAS